MFRLSLLLLFFLAGCTTSSPSSQWPAVAPWRERPLPRLEVPAQYIEQWSKAENRDTCAVMAFRSLGEKGAGAQIRAANFAGGWGIAYDLPGTRSAFGIAGAGVRADEPSYDQWPYVYEWGDGSKVEYGPEGGVGPNELAYVKVQGQDCLYNVWSRLGRDHLEFLLKQIRRVE